MFVAEINMISKKLTLLLGTLPVFVPGHDPAKDKAVTKPWAAQIVLDRHNPISNVNYAKGNRPVTAAQAYYKHFTDTYNPRFGVYEEKNPVVLVIEGDNNEDHKAEVIKIIQSMYGTENPPRIVYVDCNLLNEDAAFSIGELLKKKNISLSSVRAINFSMASWFDSTSPTSALAIRNNILKFRDSIFVHGSGNKAGGQPIYGLTTQSDHAIVVGATEHAYHEKPPERIQLTDFTASTQIPTSAVDLVMKGRNVPMDGVSGAWSKDGKDDNNPREDSGTSFSAPQVTAIAAKISARYRNLFINGLPGRRYQEELTKESLEAKDQRKQSLVDSVTSSLLLSAVAIGADDQSAIIQTPYKHSFDTKGSGFGMPHPGIAERILFDQMVASQLEGRAVQIEDYQAYSPESRQVYPRAAFKNANEEHDAAGAGLLRHGVSIHVPVPLKTYILTKEENTLAIDIPPFDTNMSAHMLRGSLLFKVEPIAKLGEQKEAVRYELFIESPDRAARIPLGTFGAEKKMLWHTDKPHPIDDFAFVNFRTRAHLLGDTVSKDVEHGWRFVVETTNKDPKDVEVSASGDKMLPLLEITGVKKEQEIFKHHPHEASRLGFLSQRMIVETYADDFARLEDKLDDNKKAQAIVEDFIEGRRVQSPELLAVLPDFFAAAKQDPSLQQVVGLIAHHVYVERIARGSAERLLHLAKYYEDTKDAGLDGVTQAYSSLYKSVLAYEKALVLGDFKVLEQQLENMKQMLKENAPHLKQYASIASNMYTSDDLIRQERQDIQGLYHTITNENLDLPADIKKSVNSR